MIITASPRIASRGSFGFRTLSPTSIDRTDAAEAHGNFALAYSVAHQPGLSHFGNAQGFLTYKTVGRTACVLADPLAPGNLWEGLVDAFLANHRRVCFWQISPGMASILSERGFSVNEFGLETWLDLAKYNFAGPKRRSFRTADNRFAASGHRVAEVPMGELDPQRIDDISLAWRNTKANSKRELGFLIRPVRLTDEPGVRKFFLLDGDGQPVAFAFFDPLHEAGRVVGYLSTTRRWRTDIDPLASYFLVRRAIETFQAEGVARLHLGLMPLHGISHQAGTGDWLMHKAFSIFHSNAWIQRTFYSSQSLSKHKESYEGETRPTFCASNGRMPVLSPLYLIRACGIV
ncbi:DUF2156 domain-containing protein [bacterium]|nr:DUF2156 domain-containing protein [bacterium]